MKEAYTFAAKSASDHFSFDRRIDRSLLHAENTTATSEKSSIPDSGLTVSENNDSQDLKASSMNTRSSGDAKSFRRRYGSDS